MALSEDAVREALKQVVDPELFVNIVDLGLVYTVTIEPAGASDATGPAEPQAEPAASSTGSGVVAESPPSNEGSPASGAQNDSIPAAQAASPGESGDSLRVIVEMTMTSPACPAGPQLVAQTKSAVGQLEGVGDVVVKLVMTPPWTPDRMTEDARDQLGIF